MNDQPTSGLMEHIQDPLVFRGRSPISALLPYIIVATYVVAMLVLGLVFHRIGDTDVETDFYWTYAPQANGILHGQLVVDDYKGPGYPIALACMKLVVGDFFSAGIVLSVLSAGLLLILSYNIVERLFHRRDVALFVLIAVALNTPFVRYTYTVCTDMFFAALFIATVFWLVRSDEFRITDFVLAGTTSGYAFITRYNGMAIFIGFLLAVVLLNTNKLSVGRRIYAAAAFFAGAALPVLPWMLYSHAMTGEFIHERNYLNVAYEIYGRDFTSWDAWWSSEAGKFGSLLDVIRSEPVLFFGRVVQNAGDHFVRDSLWVMGLFVGVFAILGLLALPFQKISRIQAMPLLFGLVYFLFLVPVFYGARFSLYFIPMYAMSAVLFLRWKKFSSLRIGRIEIGVIVLCLVLVAGIRRTVVYNSQEIVAGPVEVLNLAKTFITQHISTSDTDVVMARKPHVAYYLNMKFESFPMVSTVDELLDRCRAAHVSYLYFSQIEVNLRPQFKSLLLPGQSPPSGLSIVSQVRNPDAILYGVEQHFTQ